MAEGGSKRINVTVKTPKEKKTIECDEDETVEKVNSENKISSSDSLYFTLERPRNTISQH